MDSISLSEVTVIGRTHLGFMHSFRQPFSRVPMSPKLCSSRVEGPRAISSSDTNTKSQFAYGERIAATSDSGYKINGVNLKSRTLISSVKERLLLDANDDAYGGVIVDHENLPSNPYAFASMLRASLSDWRKKGKKGVWLKLPVEQSELVPIAIKEGFEYHHAEKGYVMLTYWIPEEEPSMLPANASHQVGVGGFVLNQHKEVLVVQEKYCAPSITGLWKLPTGFINESEEIFSGAVREVKEETGVDTEFSEVIAFRHAHNVAFEKSDLFFICMLRPLSDKIIIDSLEIKAAKWMPLVEFVEQPMIREDKMFKRVIEICEARLSHRYCGLSPHRLVSTFDGKPSSLYYNVVDDDHDPSNSNCNTDFL
ncbi:PREDICTED: nudix hydrolase 8 [Camelina sativa]|uniref:Nudix hydrolase n=1 Tax=Camelina sativa TaxID=90675 RepID=A0ABM0Y3Q4_CAMSA|nr:PREDICTED: nudix hydrolase 8 [Camelina sativa]